MSLRCRQVCMSWWVCRRFACPRVCPHLFFFRLYLLSFCVRSFLIDVSVCVCVGCVTFFFLNIFLFPVPVFSTECWRGRLLGGDGQRSHGMVSLWLCGGSDASKPRQPIRWGPPAVAHTHKCTGGKKCWENISVLHLPSLSIQLICIWNLCFVIRY